ncbi:MAG: SUMF1/EgtB/PvdO family nonheme iron enzyme, partial [Planctomycetes bacterium]|nr:SUMF1/EgtB/PvdO family nonheme iron enzyme [Planctomycetota bacterium]
MKRHILSRVTAVALFQLHLIAPFHVSAEEARGQDAVTPEGQPLVAEQWVLAIGIDKYQKCNRLRCAVYDAKAVVKVLRERYVVQSVIELYDEQATWDAIDHTLEQLAMEFQKPERKDDSLLIYYADHGKLDPVKRTGYWLPVDADRESKKSWFPNTEVKKYIAAMSHARHVLLISDSCFAGDFLRRAEEEKVNIDSPYYRQVYSKPSRMALVSGDLQPVADAGHDGHSPFASLILRTLENNQRPFLVPRTLLESIKEGVTLSSHNEQQVGLGCLVDTGSQRGEFIFFLKKEQKPREGCLVLNSQPAGAEVWIGGKRISQAGEFITIPLANEEVGEVEFVLKLEGYEEITGTVEVQRGKTARPATIELKKRAQGGLPEGLREALEIPQEAKDAYGNPIRKGSDPKSGLPLEIRHKQTGMLFVFIPVGEFMMGSPSGESGRDDDEVQHRVRLTKPFYMGKYEVTQAQWEAMTGDNPSSFKGKQNPVEQVSLEDVQGFLQELNAEGGPDKAGEYKRVYALPTEAQWEYACRAGSSKRFCFGDSDGDLGQYAWYSENSGSKTHAVGGKKANG